jgi:hypothetical protein
MVYAFFKLMPTVGTQDDWPYHTFVCAAVECKHKSRGVSIRAMPSQQAICGNTQEASGERMLLTQRTRPTMQMRCDGQPSRGSWIHNQSRQHSNRRGKARSIILTGNTQLPKQGMHPMSYANTADGKIELRFSGPRSFDGSVRISALSTLSATVGFNL